MSTLLDNPERLKHLVRLEYERGIASAELAQRNLHEFVYQAWSHVDPSPFVDGWCLGAICEHLQAVTDGQIKRLLINIAPRHTKSVTVSVMWPMWVWLRNASVRFLCASYALSLAMRDNLKSRRLVQSPWYQANYGQLFRLAGDQNMKGRFETDHGGYRLAVSVGSAATGEGGDYLLIDDPHNIDEKESQVVRESALDWFDTTWNTRLNNQQTGVMVVVGQRIHMQDLSGHILEQGGWEHLNLPTEYEPTRKCYTSIWQDPRTEEGALLWPERFPGTVLEEQKRRLGSMGYAALYQQTPVPAGGGMFRQGWIRYFTEEDDHYALERPEGIERLLKSQCHLFITVDLAISEKQESDYTVFSTWAVTPKRELLLIDVLRARLDNPSQQKHLTLLYQRFHPTHIVIEAVAYQLAFVQQIRRQGIPVREFKPVKDKVSRAITAAVQYEGGMVYHRKNTAWLTDFEQELLLFPRAEHDDMVDTTSMACEDVASHHSANAAIADAERLVELSKQRATSRPAIPTPSPIRTLPPMRRFP